MKYKNIAVTILIAIACMTVAVWAKNGQSTPKVQQWEYWRTTDVSKLNELGHQGWELVAVSGEAESAYFYFKKPKM